MMLLRKLGSRCLHICSLFSSLSVFVCLCQLQTSFCRLCVSLTVFSQSLHVLACLCASLPVFACLCVAWVSLRYLDRQEMDIKILSCQPRVKVTPRFVNNVIRDLDSIYHLCINPIRRIGLIHKWSIDLCYLKWSVHVSVLLSNCKQSITCTSLSLLAGTTVTYIILFLISEEVACLYAIHQLVHIKDKSYISCML